MASSDDTSGGRPERRIIAETREEMQRVRNVMWAELATGEATEQTQIRLAEMVVSYWDVLREFRDEVSDWPDISEIRGRLGQKSRRPADAAGLNRGTTFKTYPAVLDVPATRLLEVSQQLDDIAHELDFSASPNVSPADGEIKYAHLVSAEDDTEPDDPD